jgi:hypothetical protein
MPAGPAREEPARSVSPTGEQKRAAGRAPVQGAPTPAALARLQASAGNQAVGVAVQRLTFWTSWLRYGTQQKKNLDAAERALKDREARLRQRWQDVSPYAERLKDEHGKALDRLPALLADLSTLAVQDWDPGTSATATRAMDKVESKLTTLESAVGILVTADEQKEQQEKQEKKQVEAAATLEKRRSAAQRSVAASKAVLGVLLSLDASERGLPEVRPLQDALKKHAEQIQKMSESEGNVSDWVNKAEGFVKSVESTRQYHNLPAARGAVEKLRAQAEADRESAERRVTEERQALKQAVEGARKAVGGLQTEGEDAHGLWEDLRDALADLEDDRDKGRLPDLRQVRDDAIVLLDAAVLEADRARKRADQLGPVREKEVGQAEQARADLDPAAPLHAIAREHKKALRLREACLADLKTCSSLRGVAVEAWHKARPKLQTYRHKKEPATTTSAKVLTVEKGGSAAAPLTITHGGATYSVIESGAKLYGRLDVGALSAYPAAVPLFQNAIPNGLIASFGTGDTGVKKRSATIYELKVRRSNLTAYELPATLRVNNSAAPARTPEGYQAVTFDHAFTAH